MLANLWAWQIQEWYWFYELEPFGSEVDELRFGQVCATQVNCNSGSKSKVLLPTDFYVCMQPPNIKQSPRDMLKTMTGLFGGS